MCVRAHKSVSVALFRILFLRGTFTTPPAWVLPVPDGLLPYMLFEVHRFSTLEVCSVDVRGVYKLCALPNPRSATTVRVAVDRTMLVFLC